MSNWTIADKQVVITGGNSGIGRATAIGLAEQGARVAIVSRNRERGEAALEEIHEAVGDTTAELVVGDLGSFATTRALAEELLERYPRIHVLINNAAVWMTDRRTSPDGLETTFGVNHMGPFLLTKLLLDRIVVSQPARIINVSSGGYRLGVVNFDDLQAEKRFGKIRAYCNSKLCNMLFTRELARRLDGTSVTVNAVHPGTVNTNLGSNSAGVIRWVFDYVGPVFFKTVKQGARTPIYAATNPELSEVSGKYFARCHEVTASKAARSDEDAQRLWEISEALLQAPAPQDALSVAESTQ